MHHLNVVLHGLLDLVDLHQLAHFQHLGDDLGMVQLLLEVLLGGLLRWVDLCFEMLGVAPDVLRVEVGEPVDAELGDLLESIEA